MAFTWVLVGSRTGCVNVPVWTSKSRQPLSPNQLAFLPRHLSKDKFRVYVGFVWTGRDDKRIHRPRKRNDFPLIFLCTLESHRRPQRNRGNRNATRLGHHCDFGFAHQATSRSELNTKRIFSCPSVFCLTYLATHSRAQEVNLQSPHFRAVVDATPHQPARYVNPHPHPHLGNEGSQNPGPTPTPTGDGTCRPRNAPPDEPILDPIQIITNLTLIVFACRTLLTRPKPLPPHIHQHSHIASSFFQSFHDGGRCPRYQHCPDKLTQSW